MTKEVIYSLKALYREDFEIVGYRFGHGDKSACIVGAMRGNERQQLYICSQLVKILKQLEEHGAISHGHEILVVPSVNHYSMNVEKRFWAIDNVDINRVFPARSRGIPQNRLLPHCLNGSEATIMEFNSQVFICLETLFRMSE